MRVLIVGVYKTRDRCANIQFTEFTNLVKKAFELEVSPHFVVVDTQQRNNEEPLSAFLNPARFDQLDMVFVYGDINIAPWTPKVTALFSLLRMCYFSGEFEYFL